MRGESSRNNFQAFDHAVRTFFQFIGVSGFPLYQYLFLFGRPVFFFQMLLQVLVRLFEQRVELDAVVLRVVDGLPQFFPIGLVLFLHNEFFPGDRVFIAGIEDLDPIG